MQTTDYKFCQLGGIDRVFNYKVDDLVRATVVLLRGDKQQQFFSAFSKPRVVVAKALLKIL